MTENRSGTSSHNFGPESPEAMFYEADLLIEQGKVNEAASLLHELLEKYPSFGRACNHLGYIYETKYRDFAKAEYYYKRCLELSPEYPAAYLNYSIFLSNLEQFDELKKVLDKALSCPGINKGKVWSEYGIMYEIQGNFDQAIDAFKQAIRYSFAESDIEKYKNAIQRVRDKKIILN